MIKSMDSNKSQMRSPSNINMDFTLLSFKMLLILATQISLVGLASMIDKFLQCNLNSTETKIFWYWNQTKPSKSLNCTTFILVTPTWTWTCAWILLKHDTSSKIQLRLIWTTIMYHWIWSQTPITLTWHWTSLCWRVKWFTLNGITHQTIPKNTKCHMKYLRR